LHKWTQSHRTCSSDRSLCYVCDCGYP